MFSNSILHHFFFRWVKYLLPVLPAPIVRLENRPVHSFVSATLAWRAKFLLRVRPRGAQTAVPVNGLVQRQVALLQRRVATCVRRVDSLPKWEVAPNARVHVHREDFHLKKGKTPAARVNGVERGRIPMNWLNPVAALVHWAGTRPKNRYRPLQDVRSVLRGGIAPKLDRWSVSCYRRPCT